MKVYIDSLKVLKQDGKYTINGNIDMDRLIKIKDMSILGFGIEGYIVAAYVAAVNRVDVGFIRRERKRHGTCQRIDGCYDLNRNIVLFASADGIHDVNEFIQETNIRCSMICYFDVVEVKCLPCESLDFDSRDEYYYSEVNSYKRKLVGEEFILSSGAKSKIYYETLIAANTYKLLNDITRDNAEMILSHEVMVGVGYGGVYFALLAALINHKPFIAIDVCEKLNKLNIEGVLVFDDCTSTGSTIHKLCDSLQMDIYEISVLSLYVKRRAFLTVPNIKGCSIL